MPVQGALRGMVRKVLFVCVGNSARSQMAQGFAQKYGLPSDAVGTMPAHSVSEAAIVAMREKGIDISANKVHALDFRHLRDYDRVICMGPGVAATSPDLPFNEDWGIDDPVGGELPFFRSVRDEIEPKVKELAKEWALWSAP